MITIISKQRRRALSIGAIFSLSTVFCFGQQPGPAREHVFTRGLFTAAGVHYGREAVYTDALAWQLYTGALKQPVEGAEWMVDDRGRHLSWQPLAADSAGRFIQRRGGRGGGGGFGFGGGYLYLEYTSTKEESVLLHVQGDASLFFNGEPHAGDPYGSGWLYIPVRLKKGVNELYIRPGGAVKASLVFPDKPIQLNTEDPTVPVVVAGASENASLQGAVVVLNCSSAPLKGGRIRAVMGGKTLETLLPEVPAMGSRKVAFSFDASIAAGKGKYECTVTLLEKDRVVDEKKINIEAVNEGQQYSVTFISGIDGSLQYYAVTPQTKGEGGNVAGRAPDGAASSAGPALFLSVHGAGVEAIGQARAYQSKDWGTLVAATNRRPRGFNWEDWGRLDALEVLSLAKARFHPDERYIYLTGHSMGGHGTWFLGATYPDKWAAIGACSGYPTLKDYGSHDGVIPDSATSPVEETLLRASNQSDVIRLATNYKAFGVYILHGDADPVVPVKYARQMRKVLGDFHTDFSYHEVPGAEHWYGNQSVDWKPLFDFFKWHSRHPDSLVNDVDFTTSNPGISASFRWAGIQQQVRPLEYSRMQLHRELRGKTTSGGIRGAGGRTNAGERTASGGPEAASGPAIYGSTENIAVLSLALTDFGKGVTVALRLDSLSALTYTTQSAADTVYLHKGAGGWVPGAKPSAEQKNPSRAGTFKEAFDHRMVFVYGTLGSREEREWSLCKARYDAETWYYRGNGAVDIVADKNYTPERYQGRSVILYGNASTNSAWALLLKDCPIQVKRNELRAGDKVYTGDDLAAYFIRPLPDGRTSVAVIAGTGVKGMEAANANQYFAGASGFPDYMIFRLQMLQAGASGVLMAGFFDNDWEF
ncbi:MAG TPA: alpha/beta hydrolase-fold protein [Puia sp.]|nr:alpha/beta hydrolase-fold protein [Puia sp.]